jgi:hypothetical protein
MFNSLRKHSKIDYYIAGHEHFGFERPSSDLLDQLGERSSIFLNDVYPYCIEDTGDTLDLTFLKYLYGTPYGLITYSNTDKKYDYTEYKHLSINEINLSLFSEKKINKFKKSKASLFYYI